MAAPKVVSVGARTSPLSLAQTEEILGPLRVLYPETKFAIVPIATGGDKRKSTPLLGMERGMFVKEIELALLNGEVDFAVHSAKDLPSALPDGLVLAAFGERKDPRDVLIDRWDVPFSRLPPGARLGTSSPRRACQLRALRADVEILPIRGNIGTRLEKARGENYDGVVLAAAGLARLGRQAEISGFLDTDVCVPEVGQGALAVEARADGQVILDMLAKVDHGPTSAAVRSERSFLHTIGGGCKVPATVHARLNNGSLDMIAMAGLPDGSEVFKVRLACDAHEPEAAGRYAAEGLAKAGARGIIGIGASP